MLEVIRQGKLGDIFELEVPHFKQSDLICSQFSTSLWIVLLKIRNLNSDFYA